MLNRALKIVFLAFVVTAVGVVNSPAPFVYTPGEGWIYENPGDDSGWRAGRAEDQLEIANLAMEAGEFSLAYRAAKRLLLEWPLSDFAPDAQYVAGEALMNSRAYEKAFVEFQTLIDIYPKSERYEDALKKQYEIANKFLNGERTRILWGKIPWLPSRKKSIEMNTQVIKNGPYSDFAANAQLDIGQAYERKKGFFLSFSEKYTEAASAYERAIDRYSNNPQVVADGLFLAGVAYFRQARTGEYDQGHADEAIEKFETFISQFPQDERVPIARENIAALLQEQSRGAYLIGRFYEKNKQLKAALVYYNDSILKDPNSEYADRSREKIARLQPKVDELAQSAQ